MWTRSSKLRPSHPRPTRHARATVQPALRRPKTMQNGCPTGSMKTLKPVSGLLWRSVEAEAASAAGVELVGLKAVGPAAFVVFCGEVAGAGAGEESVPDFGRVMLVAGAPRSGRDVHDVAPALLVLDRGDAVDHVAVPPDGVSGADVGDAGEGLQE